MNNSNEILCFKDILDEAIQEKKFEINTINLKDVFDFQTEVVELYHKKSSKYLIDTVIPYLLDINCDPALLDKKGKKSLRTSAKVVYNLIKYRLVRTGCNKYHTVNDMLINLQYSISPILQDYVSDPLKMNLSEKLHSTFFNALHIPHEKLKSRGINKVDFSEDLGIARLTMDYKVGDNCVCTCKVLQGTSGTDYIAEADFKLVINYFKENFSRLSYKYLIIIFDFPTANLKNTTKDWVRSYNKKVKIMENIKTNSGDLLDKNIFIGRFKDLYNSGSFSHVI